MISEDVRLALTKAVEPFENVPDKEKDWHPNSNDQVLDLVHPSIYPLVYGQTKILPSGTVNLENCFHFCGQGETLPRPNNDGDYRWSKTFQWLPADFNVPQGTDKVKITSYINNMHPQKHPELYSVIEDVVSKAIPMWNKVLTRANDKCAKARIIMSDDGYGDRNEVEPEWADDRDDDENERIIREWKESRPIVQPEPQKFEAAEGDDIPTVNLRSNFKEHLQIIVKLANIHLTPESPDYPGGSWHVEGQANENICASALYYYSSENITDSHLAFRQGVDEESAFMDFNYEQDDHRAVETIYGFQNGDAAIQNLGVVNTRQSRLLAFPNTMQHQVQPFSLDDKTRPGHRKLLALFLVDPHQQIISAANVPCQQKSWWEEIVRPVGPLGTKFPVEIVDQIFDSLGDFPVSLEEAKKQRLELMEERSNLVENHNQNYVYEGGSFNVRLFLFKSSSTLSLSLSSFLGVVKHSQRYFPYTIKTCPQNTRTCENGRKAAPSPARGRDFLCRDLTKLTIFLIFPQLCEH